MTLCIPHAATLCMDSISDVISIILSLPLKPPNAAVQLPKGRSPFSLKVKPLDYPQPSLSLHSLPFPLFLVICVSVW